VQEWFAGQVITTGLVVHLQLIETETEEEALVAQLRIDSGEDFAVVAQEVSTDTLSAEDGGDLGWLATGQLAGRYGEEVENEVFAMDVGKMSVVQSNEMFYLVELLDRNESGPLPEEVVQPLQDNALNEWLEERKTSPEVQIERLLEPSQIPGDPFL
jgi:parvulin-like peptidyl-prolyl isomerase